MKTSKQGNINSCFNELHKQIIRNLKSLVNKHEAIRPDGKQNSGQTLTLICPSKELYDDAVYFKNHIENTTILLEKQRYRRVSLICFCAATEAWINSQFWSQLENKIAKSGEDSLNDNERKLHEHFEEVSKTPPAEYISVEGQRVYMY